MGILQSKKVKLETLDKETGFQYILDYDRLKRTDTFYINLLEEFTKNNKCLLVIDSDNFYVRKNSERESKIAELKFDLSNQEIDYKEIVIQKEAESKLLGIKLQNAKKVNSYKIAVTALPGQMKNVFDLLKKYNLFYYISSDNADVSELDEMFQDANGNFEKLRDKFQYILYNDCLFHRIRVISKTEIKGLLNDIISKYENT